MEMMLIMGIGVLLFGKRLPEVGRSLGRGIVEFKKGLNGVGDDLDPSVEQPIHSSSYGSSRSIGRAAGRRARPTRMPPCRSSSCPGTARVRLRPHRVDRPLDPTDGLCPPTSRRIEPHRWSRLDAGMPRSASSGHLSRLGDRAWTLSARHARPGSRHLRPGRRPGGPGGRPGGRGPPRGGGGRPRSRSAVAGPAAGRRPSSSRATYRA